MLLRGQNLLGYRHYPDDVVRKFIEKSAHNGIDVFRIFDAMNDVRNMEESVRAVKNMGKHAEGAISYTTSPVHDTVYFVNMAIRLAEMGCDTIAIKDMAGLLTPYAVAELVSAILKKVNLPIHIHSHATGGVASMVQMKAVESGATIIDTCNSSFSEGTSHPTTESMVAAFKGTSYDTGLNLAKLQEVTAYMKDVRKKYWQFESEYTGVDTRVLVNQVPGGMISNLANQLKDQGALERMNEVLEEIPRVREDLGYPPLVTPTSQIVGTQAVLNVLTGERYKSVSSEVKNYLKGLYGKTPGEVNGHVRSLAIGNIEVVTMRPADLLNDELGKLAQEIGSIAKSDEDILTYAMFPEMGRTFLEERNQGTLKPEILLPKDAMKNAVNNKAPNEFNITMHGETYHIQVSTSGNKDDSQRSFFISVDGVPEEVMLETLHEVDLSGAPVTSSSASAPHATGKRPRATKPGHVISPMPGTVIELLVKEGDTVKKGQAVAVVEAMKMQNEVPATIDGTVSAIFIKKGDTITSSEALLEIS
jgi:pyruvate carboxylase subunit B